MGGIGLRRTGVSAALALVAATGGVLLGAGVAQAAPSNCNLGNYCGYYNTRWAGDIDQYPGNVPDLRRHQHPGHGNWDNQYSSVWNNGTTCQVTFYNNYRYNHNETYRTFAKGTGRATLGDIGMGNSISSVRWCTV